MSYDFEDQLFAQGASPSSVEQAKAAIKKLSLPLPRSNQFVGGYSGTLIFLENEALVIRIEKSDSFLSKKGQKKYVRSSHPLILNPLLSIDCEDLTVEVCPGVHVNSGSEGIERSDANPILLTPLNNDGLSMWDYQAENTGRIRAPNLPEQGVTVVIDRNSVERLSETPTSYLAAIRKHGNPQAQFSPLRRAARRAFKRGDMSEFYTLCREFKQNKTLVCGWKKSKNKYSKTGSAAKASKAYRRRIKNHRRLKDLKQYFKLPAFS